MVLLRLIQQTDNEGEGSHLSALHRIFCYYYPKYQRAKPLLKYVTMNTGEISWRRIAQTTLVLWVAPVMLLYLSESDSPSLQNPFTYQPRSFTTPGKKAIGPEHFPQFWSMALLGQSGGGRWPEMATKVLRSHPNCHFCCLTSGHLIYISRTCSFVTQGHCCGIQAVLSLQRTK